MADVIKITRAIGGLLTILVLLTMLLAQFVYPQFNADANTITLLLMLTGALLGIDISLERFSPTDNQQQGNDTRK